jgi:uncharacterized membrane protein
VSAPQLGPEVTPQEALRHAPRRYTSAVLTVGVVVAAVCFAVALAAELVSGEPGSGELTDVAAVLDGLLSLDAWSWAAAGVYAVVATPLVGLVVTAGEYASIGDRRAVGLAIAVIAVLAASAAVAVLR